MCIKSTRYSIALEVNFARHGIESNLMRFKDRAPLVIIFVSDWIVLVVVALGTVHGQTKEGLTRVLDRVVEPGCAIEKVVVPR